MSLVHLWETIYTSVCSIEVNLISSAYKLLLSALLGGIIGYERKRRGQAAGVRTFSLIAMGASLAMILSIYVPQEYLGLKNGDPGRIAAQVVTGIGFLGAGAIIQMKGSVRGLTTAAGIWIVAAIGLAVGVGMYIVAIIATVLILAILVGMDKIEHSANLGTDLRNVKISVNSIVDNIDTYKTLLNTHKITITRFNIEYNYTLSKTDINLLVLIPEGVNFLSLIQQIRSLYPTEALSVSNHTES